VSSFFLQLFSTGFARDVPAWLSLILADRPWPASEASAANHHPGDSFDGQNHLPVAVPAGRLGRHGYEPSPNIL